MSDPETPLTLTRWLRRKNDARTNNPDVGAGSHGSDADASGSGTLSSGAVLPFDVTNLPTLESIGAGTDLGAFLSQGVPAELTAAALRRGWSADPAIRDFIGLSENSWDFNTPGGIPGFGALSSGDAQRLLAQVIEESGMSKEAAPASAAPPSSDQTVSQMTESVAGLEMSQAVSANDLGSHSEQKNQLGNAEYTQSVSANGLTGATQFPGDQDCHRPSRRHRHGGARPMYMSADLDDHDMHGESEWHRIKDRM